MDATFEQRVRERAYGLWIESGRIHGMAHEHWCTAEAAMRDKPFDALPLPVSPLPISPTSDLGSVAEVSKGKAKTASKSSATKPVVGKAAGKFTANRSKTGKAAGAKSAASKAASKVVLTDARPTTSQMVN